MGFSTSTCTEFVEVLASKAPVPGGGGASVAQPQRPADGAGTDLFFLCRSDHRGPY